MRRVALFFSCAMAATGCGDNSDTAAPTVWAQVTAVDLEGAPLPGMRPIATLNPNAFDAPIVQGELTDELGQSSLALPRTQYLYVRAWDPELHYFAANYFDVPPSLTGEATEKMVVTMAEGSALRVTMVLPDGSPFDNQRIDLMLTHPDRGLWWPARAMTDEQGLAVFSSLPPGRYQLSLDAPPNGRADIDSVILSAAGETDLGTIRLRSEVPGTSSE